jgi:hypothetical protein
LAELVEAALMLTLRQAQGDNSFCQPQMKKVFVFKEFFPMSLSPPVFIHNNWISFLRKEKFRLVLYDLHIPTTLGFPLVNLEIVY